jgi:uncharacterized membrane protein YfcA
MLTTSFIGTKEDFEQKKINFNIIKINFPGAIIGVLIGIFLFKKLSLNGQIDIVVSFLYIFVLGSISSFMLIEVFYFFKEKYFQKNQNYQIELEKTKNKNLKTNEKKKNFIEKIDIFPYKITLENGAQISIFLMSFFSFFAGLLAAIAGVGSGLIMIPVMIYIYKMQTRHAMATSNFNGGLIVVLSNILQILTVKKTDFILSFLLLCGSVLGLVISRKFADKIPSEGLRLGLGILMMFIVLKMILNISLTPKDIFLVNSIN